MRVRLLFSSAVQRGDPARAVLPALLYIKNNEDAAPRVARCLMLGWWAWGVGFVVITKG